MENKQDIKKMYLKATMQEPIKLGVKDLRSLRMEFILEILQDDIILQKRLMKTLRGLEDARQTQI